MIKTTTGKITVGDWIHYPNSETLWCALLPLRQGDGVNLDAKCLGGRPRGEVINRKYPYTKPVWVFNDLRDWTRVLEEVFDIGEQDYRPHGNTMVNFTFLPDKQVETVDYITIGWAVSVHRGPELGWMAFLVQTDKPEESTTTKAQLSSMDDLKAALSWFWAILQADAKFVAEWDFA